MTRFFHRPRFSFGVVLLLGVALVLTGCDQESLNAPEIADSGQTDGLFNSYVAIGNSITAGFQSGGINKNLQQDSYAVRLAQQMNTPFGIPAFKNPGCKPPLEQIFPPERIADVNCERRTRSAEPVRNVAVPGARVIDALTNDESQGANPNQLTSLILGSRTQIQAATERNPTFASVWIGNNDVLNAALAGNPNLITPQSDFKSNYKKILNKLENAGAKGGVIANVFNVTQIPNLSPGAAYSKAKKSGDLPSTIDAHLSVASNCAPGGVGDQMFVSFRYGSVFLTLASQGRNVTLDCKDNRTLLQIFGDPTLNDLDLTDEEKTYSLLTKSEVPSIISAVQNYNSFLEQEATNRDWAYVDAKTVLDNLYSQGASTPTDPSDDLIPRFPRLASDTPTFGPVFSEDGVHPTSATHRLITNKVIESINAKYGSSLQKVEGPGF